MNILTAWILQDLVFTKHMCVSVQCVSDFSLKNPFVFWAIKMQTHSMFYKLKCILCVMGMNLLASYPFNVL